MSEQNFKCKKCGAKLELFEATYSKSPIDEETGEIGVPYEENIPGESIHTEVQCSENADHDCGFTIDELGDTIKEK